MSNLGEITYTGAVALTTSDSAVLSGVRGLYIGVSGDVAVVSADKTASVIFKSAPVGVLPIEVTKVLATGTTATNILALN